MESELLAELERHGIVRLPDLLSEEQLSGMQVAFAARLQRMRWNDYDGYEKTERYRHMIEDVLTLDQGFVDVALHPVVKAVLRGYLGDRFQLVEAKGWRSLPYPSDNFFPASLEAVGFVDHAGGNYRLAPFSPYRKAGTDGKDIGADIDALQPSMTQTLSR